MTENQNGPPIGEVPAPQGKPAPTTTDTAEVDTPDDTRSAGTTTFERPAIPKLLPRICTDTVSQMQRRRGTKRRMVPLSCGCPDPWPCTCSSPLPSERMIDAGRDAALHILATGKLPLLEIELLHSLYRRGGHDRELAEWLYAATGYEVA